MKIRMSTARKMMKITQIELKAVLNTSQTFISRLENDQRVSREMESKFILLFKEWKASEIQKHLNIIEELKGLEVSP